MVNLSTSIQAGLVVQRRFLVLHLPYWPTDCLKRRENGLDNPERALALFEPVKGAMRLAAIDKAGIRAGLKVGQNLADARAQVPELELRQIDRPLLEAVFADFADWHSYASPLVAVLAEPAGYGDLVLDITGVAHLFGGETNMLRTLLERLRGLGFSVNGAVASSIGAGWALSHFARAQVLDGSIAEALANLPVAALRLSETQVSGLMQMGLKRIGQLYDRPRKPLQARFGVSLLTRLDQALGQIEEAMTPRLPEAERFAERKFAEPIGLMDDVLACAQDLAVRLALQLEDEGLGAQSFHLFLYRVDHKVMRLSVNSGRPTRDAHHISRLFANRAERLEGEYDPGFGIDMVRLAASSVADLGASQIGAFETDEGAEDLDQLYDRMTSRLGPFAVVRQKFIDTHIPEQAVVFEPVIARTDDNPRALPDPALPRPLRLLPVPEPISVLAQVPDGPPAAMIWRRVRYPFIRASGPERIGAEWWLSRQRLELMPPIDPQTLEKGQKLPYQPKLERFDADAATRDYYVAEDDGGRCFWLYRQGLFFGVLTPSWHLHGFFS